jgi:hypothetical protein
MLNSKERLKGLIGLDAVEQMVEELNSQATELGFDDVVPLEVDEAYNEAFDHVLSGLSDVEIDELVVQVAKYSKILQDLANTYMDLRLNYSMEEGVLH